VPRADPERMEVVALRSNYLRNLRWGRPDPSPGENLQQLWSHQRVLRVATTMSDLCRTTGNM
jgi:hypothetical protein